MLIMTMELLAASFILGMGITAVVLAAVSGVDALVRAKHAIAAAGAEVGQSGPRPVTVLGAHLGDSSPAQRRAA
jgi:hypothetical protein